MMMVSSLLRCLGLFASPIFTSWTNCHDHNPFCNTHRIVSSIRLLAIRLSGSQGQSSMFSPIHCGLFFTPDHIEQAHTHADEEPFRTAWAYLREESPTEPVALIQWNALRYRFDEDANAGARAIDFLRQYEFDFSQDLLTTTKTWVTLAQSFEMIRGHKALTGERADDWMATFADVIATLNNEHDLALYEQLWLALLRLIAGIVLEQQTHFDAGVAYAKQFVAHEIRPQGHIPRLVEASDGRGLYRQLIATQALVLIAEAATHAGHDLWSFHHRGVSVMTPVVYLLYYYFYPDQWKWDPLPENTDESVTDEDESSETDDAIVVHPDFATIKGFWEIAHRYGRPKDFKLLLENARPIYDAYGGGLTTLTHGLPLKKRRGLFGRYV
ncbi:MAG: hypothetical protein D6737_05100 [Chloroflexi bacterium]|nr:MAG: hypothetical protein D6737_05100 [Chloroflexota bacterium]